MTMMIVRRDNPDVAVVARRELIPGDCLLSGAYKGDQDELCFEYSGGTNVDWDRQVPLLRDGRQLFVDENGCCLTDEQVALVEVGGTLLPMKTLVPAHAVENAPTAWIIDRPHLQSRFIGPFGDRAAAERWQTADGLTKGAVVEYDIYPMRRPYQSADAIDLSAGVGSRGRD